MGLITLLLCVALIVYIINKKPKVVSNVRDDAPEIKEHEDMPLMKLELEKAIEGCAITIEQKERTVLSNITLNELYQQEGSKEWQENGKTSKAILLSGDIWLMRIPAKEAGQYVWVKFSVKEYASSLGGFFKGDAQAGPAKMFAMGKQRQEIPYSLFDQTWKVTDIGTFKVECSAKKDNKGLMNEDRIYFVTSKGADKSWMLYLDARHGEARATGAVLIGEEFNPDTDIDSIL